MQATSTIETGIDDDTIAEVVLSEDLLIHVAVAGIAHTIDVDKTQTTVG